MRIKLFFNRPAIWGIVLSATIAMLLLLPLFSWSQNTPTFTYQISVSHPQRHYFDVSLTIENLHQDSMELKMPVWTPGYYWILDLPANVFNFKAVSPDGNIPEWKKTAKNSWQIATRGIDKLSVQYQVYADGHSVAEPYLDENKAFISPTGIYMFAEGYINQPVAVSLQIPTNWSKACSGLAKTGNKKYSWNASNFDELYDCPIVAGNQKIDSFYYQNRPYYLVFDESIIMESQTITTDFQKIVQAADQMMGDIPFKEYYFFFLGEGFGGLEHRNSMAVFSGSIPPYSDQKEYVRFMSFIAHEYFHLYNVKAIRPIALGPFDYSRENYTNMLWVSEGFTVYYEYLLMYRAGFIDREQLLAYLSSVITHFENLPGRPYQSATQSSFDTWLNFFRFTNPHTQNTTLSYYDLGCALGLLLDLEIQHSSHGQKSLDDVMRYLYKNYYQQLQRGFSDNEFRQACQQIAGNPLDEIFRYASTTGPFDYAKYLGYAGITLQKTSEYAKDDFYGIRLEKRENGSFISELTFGSPAFASELKPGDQILELNNQPANDLLFKQIAESNPKEAQIDFTILREGKKFKTRLQLDRKAMINYSFSVLDHLTDEQQTILNKWLSK